MTKGLECFRLENLERLILYAFVASLPFQVKKVFLTPFSYFDGAFSSTTTYILYLSDILALLLLIFGFHRIYSRFKKGISKIHALALVFLGVVAVTSMGNLTDITIYGLVRILIYTGVFIYASEVFHVKLIFGDDVSQRNLESSESRETSFTTSISLQNLTGVKRSCIIMQYFSRFFKNRHVSRETETLENQLEKNSGDQKDVSRETSRVLLWIFLIAMLFEAILGLYQFSAQGSLGLRYLGEEAMNPSLRGVAKINIARDVIPQYFYDFVNVSRATFGETVKLIRPAGTFPHANIFGGFLMVAIFAAYVLWSRGIKKILPRVLLAASFPIFLAALLVTFSRTSWAGFILGAIFCLFLFIYIWRKDKNVSGIKRMLDRQKKIAAWIFLWLITLVIFFFPLFRIRFGIPDVSEPSYSSRILFADIAVEMIKKYPLVGIGLNNFVLRMDEFAPRDLFGYEHQPVHNIYLLIASESGIIALVAFAVILIAVLFNALRRQTFLYFMFAIMLSAILFINLFDHYWWTYPPAAYLFWILLGIAAAPKTYRDDLKTPLESLYSWSEVQK